MSKYKPVPPKTCDLCGVEYTHSPEAHKWECEKREKTTFNKILPSGFTARQELVKAMCESGKPVKQIARELEVSEKAIWCMVTVIRKKIRKMNPEDPEGVTKKLERLPNGFTEFQENARRLREKGLTCLEIARELGTSEASVFVTLRNVREKLFRLGQGENAIKVPTKERYPLRVLPPKQVFEIVRRKLLQELRKRTDTPTERAKLSSEELAAYLKLCRENIAQEMDYSDTPEGRPIQLVHNMPIGEKKPEVVQELTVEISPEEKVQ